MYLYDVSSNLSSSKRADLKTGWLHLPRNTNHENLIEILMRNDAFELVDFKSWNGRECKETSIVQEVFVCEKICK